MTDEPRAERERGANYITELLTLLNYLNYGKYHVINYQRTPT